MEDVVLILGNKINCFGSYEALYAYLISCKQAGATGYVTVNNVHTMVEGHRHKDYQKIINEGFLSLPDGKPLQVVGKLKGNSTITRLFGPTVMEKFIDWGRRDGVSHFFFGSSEANLQKLRTAIELKYPGAKIAGMISPPYKPTAEWDNKGFTDAINAAQPDFVWVGLGAPKQERWMAANIGQMSGGIMFGIGAGFDYLAGNTRHAPEWMKNFSLEWLYRLGQEPGRLWKRYFSTIPPFLVLASMELLSEKLKKKK